MISLEFLIEKRYSTTKETQTFPVHTILHAVNNHYSTLLSRFVIFRQQEEEKRIKTQYFRQGKVMGILLLTGWPPCPFWVTIGRE